MISVNFPSLLRNVFSFLGTSLAVLSVAQLQVSTYHNDNMRTGWNQSESILTPKNVNSSTFGLLFNIPVDGMVYAQPLYVQGLTIPGQGIHNVIFVATEHNSVYAFDADNNLGANLNPLWHVNFGASMPSSDIGTTDVIPEIGITGTPVIYKMRNGTQGLYVVSKTKTVTTNGPVYTQTIHVLSLTTGAELLNGPFVISGQVPGVGEGSSNGVLKFDPYYHLQRPALLIVPRVGNTGTLYVTFCSHSDLGPYHGWVFEYDADTMALIGILCTTPNALNDPSGYPIAGGGIWMGGAGPSSDGTSVYLATGNGGFGPTNQNYGDSLIRFLDRTTRIADYFTPADQESLDDYDTDLGSGGVVVVPPNARGTLNKTLLVQVGKEGTVHLLDASNLGKYGATDNILQELPFEMGGIFGSPCYFNNTIFFGPNSSSILGFTLKSGNISPTSPAMTTPDTFKYPGPTPSVSSNGTLNGILWALDTSGASTSAPSILHAYNALALNTELYNSSSTGGRDQLDPAVKFVTPTVINGKVYVGATKAVDVFGLGAWPLQPVISPASGTTFGTVTATISEATAGATIRYTTDGTTPTYTSPIYNGPITINQSTTLQARAFLTTGASATVANYYLINPMIGTGTGLTGNYYANTEVASGTPTFTRLDPVINFNWGGLSPGAGVGGTDWAAMWTGQVQAMTTGTYTFQTYADDGAILSINGTQLSDSFSGRPPTTASATYSMVAGQIYTITLQYFQGTSGSAMRLSWSAPGLPLQVIPTSQLYPSN